MKTWAPCMRPSSVVLAQCSCLATLLPSFFTCARLELQTDLLKTLTEISSKQAVLACFGCFRYIAHKWRWQVPWNKTDHFVECAGKGLPQNILKVTVLHSLRSSNLVQSLDILGSAFICTHVAPSLPSVSLIFVLPPLGACTRKQAQVQNCQAKWRQDAQLLILAFFTKHVM